MITLFFQALGIVTLLFIVVTLVTKIIMWVKDVNYRIEIMKCDRTNIYNRLEDLERKEK